MSSPALAPSTMATWVGAPRGRRAGLAFAWRRACFSARRSERGAESMRAPNMSDRTTEIAESTKIHRIAR